MATEQQDASFRPRPFRVPGALPPTLDAEAAAALLLIAGDLSLVLAHDGTVLDVAIASAELAADGVADWQGQRLVELVTIESKPKIASMLAQAEAGEASRWRQVNHPVPGGEVPVRYACVVAGDRLIAIGRDLRVAAAAQQQLLQAQQSLERDYLRLRQAESRYRLLFDLAEEPVAIVDAATRRIVEANPATHRLLDAAPGTLARQPAGLLVAESNEDALFAYLGAAAAGATAPVALALRTGVTAQLAATPFRQDRATYLLVRLATSGKAAEVAGGAALVRAVERMPDGFVLTDRRLIILAANAAFAEMVNGVAAEMAVGQPLGEWLGRPGVDLELVAAQLREHGVVRNVATIVRGAGGVQEEVELSGVLVEDGRDRSYGFAIRSVARRLRDLPPVDRDLPRSVEQLTELVGRVALKDIVRESTDLIERLCIEAALAYTSDNRASAAEILGLSRQGLYSKLHRHGLGNLVDDR